MPNMFQLKCPCMSARVPAGPLMRQTHLHIFTSSHLHIFTHLLSLSLFFTSSHLHIFSLSLPLSRALSCPLSLSLAPSLSLSLALLPSCPLSRSLSFFFFSLFRPRAVPTRRHKVATLSPKRGSSVKNWGKNCDFRSSAATFSHETRFECQKSR